MANYNGKFRSNYFRVKDPETFRAWVETLHGEETPDVFEGSGEHEGKYGLGAYSGIPSSRNYTESEKAKLREAQTPGIDLSGLDDDMEYCEDLDFFRELGQHLQAGEIAVIVECGYEKLRYLVGASYAVNDQGEVIQHISIDDIYQALPSGLSTATY